MASAESLPGCTVVAHITTGQGGEQHGSGKEKATVTLSPLPLQGSTNALFPPLKYL